MDQNGDLNYSNPRRGRLLSVHLANDITEQETDKLFTGSSRSCTTAFGVTSVISTSSRNGLPIGRFFITSEHFPSQRKDAVGVAERNSLRLGQDEKNQSTVQIVTRRSSDSATAGAEDEDVQDSRVQQAPQSLGALLFPIARYRSATIHVQCVLPVRRQSACRGGTVHEGGKWKRESLVDCRTKPSESVCLQCVYR